MSLDAKHTKYPQAIKETACPIGSVPRADIFQAAAAMQSYLRNWVGGGLIAVSEPQPPDTTLNPIPTSATPLHYYPIFWSPDKTDATDRQLGASMAIWHSSTADDASIDWYPDYAPGTPGSATNLYSRSKATLSKSLSYGDQRVGGTLHLYDDFTFDPNNSDWLVKRLSIVGLNVASLAIFHCPDGLIDSDQVLVSQSDVTSGQVIRGYTGSGRRSVGDLFHLTGSMDDTSDDMERITRRCLSQICTGYGFYVPTGTTSWHRVYGANFEFRVRPRPFSDLGSPDTGVISPAFVITGDAGCQIRVTNSTTSDTWTYTIPGGGISNPTLVEPSDGTGTIDFTLTQDNDVYIDVQTGATEEMVIYTSSLWEDVV